jgi:hypothetical protein
MAVVRSFPSFRFDGDNNETLGLWCDDGSVYIVHTILFVRHSAIVFAQFTVQLSDNNNISISAGR